MDTSSLENIGFSPTEIKIFVTILQLGESKAGKIIERTNLQSSSVYNAINALIEKGFLSYIKKSKVKYYKAAEPETILDYIDLKKREYLKLLPELKMHQKSNSEEGVEFYRSYNGIKTLMLELFKDAKKNDVYRTFAVQDPLEYEKARERVYRTMKQLAADKKILMRGLFHESTRYAKTKSSIMQKRYLSIPLPPNTIILDNKIAIISWQNEPSGILIHSKDMADSYANFFDSMWKISKR